MTGNSEKIWEKIWEISVWSLSPCWSYPAWSRGARWREPGWGGRERPGQTDCPAERVDAILAKFPVFWGSGMFIPDPNFSTPADPHFLHPGSRQKGTGSQIRIRNTGNFTKRLSCDFVSFSRLSLHEICLVHEISRYQRYCIQRTTVLLVVWVTNSCTRLAEL